MRLGDAAHAGQPPLRELTGADALAGNVHQTLVQIFDTHRGRLYFSRK
jgi:hypothetical protein